MRNYLAKWPKQYAISALFFLSILLIWFRKIGTMTLSDISVKLYTSEKYQFFIEPILSKKLGKLMIEGLPEGTLLFICAVVLPFVIYLLLFTTFKRFTNTLWGANLAIFALISSPDYPFRNFLQDLMQFRLSTQIEVIPEIFKFPIPSISTLYFLAVFTFTSEKNVLVYWRSALVSALWAICLYFNAIDALFGISFWVITLHTRGRMAGKLRHHYFILMFMVFATLVPLALAGKINFGGLVSLKAGVNVELYILLYFFLPVFLMSLAYWAFELDPYEVFKRFYPIYFLLLIEFLIVLFTLVFNNGINLQILSSTIPLFFLHLFYYVPIINISNDSRRRPRLHLDDRYSSIKSGIQTVLIMFFEKLSKFYIPIILFSLFLFSSAVNR